MLPSAVPDIAFAALGYLLGSIPFGLLLTRVAGLGDIRKIGSGNIGATNVLRTGRKGLAAATLLLDGGKGAAAVLIGAALAGRDAALWAGLARRARASLPGLAGLQGRQGGRHQLRHADRRRLAGGPRRPAPPGWSWRNVGRFSSLGALTAVRRRPAAAPGRWPDSGAVKLSLRRSPC